MRIKIYLFLLFLGITKGIYDNKGDDTLAHKFDPKHKEKLDNKERREKFPPREILRRFELEKGSNMLDIGCGIGYFSIPASEIVGKEGNVYAVDTSEEMLEEVRKKIKENNIKNMVIINSDEYSARLRDNNIDFILISNVMHEIDDKDRFLKNYLNSLNIGGRLAIIEWKKVDTESGPPLKARLDDKDLENILKEHNIKLVNKLDLTDTHYGVLLEKY